MPRPPLTAILLAGALTLGSCAKPSQTSPWQRVVSFTDGEVSDWLRMPDVYRQETVFEWRFDSSEDLRDWVLRDISARPNPNGGPLLLKASSEEAFIQRNHLQLEADSIHSLVVRRAGTLSRLSVLWARGKEDFNADRAVYRRPTRDLGEKVQTQVLPVDGHQDWTGTISRLRLNPVRTSEPRTRILSIRGVRRSLDGERLAELVNRPALQDLGRDARLALLAPPGYEHCREVDNLPAQARLNLAMGLSKSSGPEITFRVELRQGDTVRELDRVVLDPQWDGDHWHEKQVDLSSESLPEIDRKRMEICLITDGPDARELLDGLPLWANPEILARPAQGAGSNELPPNLVLIVADTLRPDRMSLYGHDRDTTPRLNRWAKRRAMVFEQAIGAAPWTLPAHASLFSGQNAVRHGANFSNAIPSSMPLMAEILRRRGYATYAFTGSGYLGPDYGLSRGFDRFVHTTGLTRTNAVRRDIVEYLPKVVDLLKDPPRQPFFLFIHTYETHSPYYPREPWMSRLSDQKVPEFFDLRTNPQTAKNGWRTYPDLMESRGGELVPLTAERLPALRATYDSSVAYLDDKVGQILDALSSTGLESDTVVAFTSDHGEALGERPETPAGHSFLYDFNLRIPLAIALPDGDGAGRRVGRQVRQVDIAPTLFEALGLDPEHKIDGESLLPFWHVDDEMEAGKFPNVAESYAASSNYGMGLRVEGRWKYIAQNSPWAPIAGRQELFDLRAEQPENRNLAQSRTEVAQGFRQELESRFNTQSCRLQMTVQNGGQTPWSLQFRGPAVNFSSVKTWSSDCPGCVTLKEPWMRLALPAGQTLTVSWSGFWNGQGEIKVADPPGQHELLIPYYPKSIIGGNPLGKTIQSGRVVDAQSPNLPADARGFWIERQGQGCQWNPNTKAPTPVDEETRRQLEALGYVNP